MRFVLPLVALLAGIVGASANAQPRADDQATFFETKIRPVLVTKCFQCHGGQKTSNNLRVDSLESLVKGGDSGAAVLPGHPEKSLLIRAIRYSDDELKMPPDKRLPDAVVGDFEQWIKTGAFWQKKLQRNSWKTAAEQRHWAFEPVKKADPPRDPTGWSVNEVDRFIQARLRHEGLKPVAAADKRALLRRVTFDLIGLPPSPNAIYEFLADHSPQAFSKVVENLLASPQYGERWGRYWMDVVRYADTAGDNADYPVPEARLYRDYIIDSFNADKPYNEFVREQVAGDLLAAQGPPEQYAQRVIATGFLALSRRYATAPYELWHLTLEDTIDTVGRAYLGMTIRCARCHDHKFDPVTMRDYYRLYGIFASTRFPYAGSEEFQSMKFGRRAFASLLPTSDTKPLLADYAREQSELKGRIAALERTLPRGKAKKSLDALRTRLKVLERRGSPETLPVAYAVSEGTIADVPLQMKGEPSQPGPVVSRGVPQFLPGLPGQPPKGSESGRLELADWLVSPQNPLTARVLVNRVWQHHFGRGIVATPSNFGLRGSPPSHPELLDWLTATFLEHGWSIKHLHRVILSSRTYQLSSADDPANRAVDAANRWYWKFDRQRLDAEAIRDAMLAVSGTLERDRPGPHPFPPIQEWTWTQHFPFKAAYPSRHRSVYLMTQRLHRHPFLGLFDGPDTNTTTDVRSTSTVPLQALFLMNSDFMRETSAAFAARLIRDSAQVRERIQLAHQLAFARGATAEEIRKATAYIDRYQAESVKTGLKPPAAQREAWLSYARTILASNEFFYVD